MSELVSVVIPCRNEVKSIEATVQALLESDHQHLEILVVDGMSEDGTRDVLKKLSEQDLRVQIIDNPQKLTPYAFNLGVKSAKGEYIQIVGSRNVLERDYLRLLVEELKRQPKVACVGGDYQHVYDSEAGRFIALAMESKFGVGAGNYRTMKSDAFVDTVGVPMYRKHIFDEVGYFDESLTRNQDDDFNYRVRQRAYLIKYVHAAKVTYLVRGSLKKAFQQFRQYGYFKVFVNRKHHRLTTWRQVIPAIFVATFAIGLPFSLLEDDIADFLGWIAAFYVVLGLGLAGKGLPFLDRVRVLFTCFVLHVGYGFGYWQGIWDFIVHNQSAPRSELQRQTT